MSIYTKLLCLALTLLCNIFAGSVAFGACDPNAILRSNVSQYNENIMVWLAYVKNLEQSSNISDSSSIGLSYDGFGLNYGDASALAQYINDRESYSVAGSDSVSILRSTLSPDSVNAYIACLHSMNPVTLILPDFALGETEFPITVHWNPDYPAKDNQKLTMTVIHGTVDNNKSTTTTMNRTDEKTFTIKRDNDGAERLIVYASIFGKVSDPVSIAPIPKFVLKLKPKFEPPLDKGAASICRSGQCGTTYVKFTYCVYPDAGSLLLPSTLKYIGEKLIGDPNRSHAGIVESDTLHACGFIDSSAGGNTDYNLISGRFLAVETDLEPVGPSPAAIMPAIRPLRANRLENLDKIIQDAQVKE